MSLACHPSAGTRPSPLGGAGHLATVEYKGGSLFEGLDCHISRSTLLHEAVRMFRRRHPFTTSDSSDLPDTGLSVSGRTDVLTAPVAETVATDVTAASLSAAPTTPPSINLPAGPSANAATATDTGASEVTIPTDTHNDYSSFTRFTDPDRRDADWQSLQRVMHEASNAETEGRHRIAESYAKAAEDALFDVHTDWDTKPRPIQKFLWEEQMEKYKELSDDATISYIDSVRTKASEMYSSWRPKEYEPPILDEDVMTLIACLPDSEPTLDWMKQLEETQERETNKLLTILSSGQDQHPDSQSSGTQEVQETFNKLEYRHEMQRQFIIRVIDANPPTGGTYGSDSDHVYDANPFGEGRA
ncbi:hypothetical protein IAU59_006144 [Kwoniella sp. CBS 9459]